MRLSGLVIGTLLGMFAQLVADRLVATWFALKARWKRIPWRLFFRSSLYILLLATGCYYGQHKQIIKEFAATFEKLLPDYS